MATDGGDHSSATNPSATNQAAVMAVRLNGTSMVLTMGAKECDQMA